MAVDKKNGWSESRPTAHEKTEESVLLSVFGTGGGPSTPEVAMGKRVEDALLSVLACREKTEGGGIFFSGTEGDISMSWVGEGV